MIDWSSLVLDCCDGYELRPPVSEHALERAQLRLGVQFSAGVLSLYRTTNGVHDGPGFLDLVWPIERVVEDNLLEWDLFGTPRDRYVGFGDYGTGDPFCVARSGGDAVYFYDYIDKEATWLAADPVAFWNGLCRGTLPPH